MAQAKVCSERDATAADAMVDHLDSWSQVNVTFTKYGHCDDGEIAEGNSEGIARLLVDHWETLPQLGVLIRRNPRLKAFVLRHIDSTLDTVDLTKISSLATSSCPPGMGALCHDLGTVASKAGH
ncbi:hypothetical protein DWV00_12675 [Trinickia dinghuensis]|uniref:Uncharacterized protein n=2 Tax=Trinickia dinghuensis TaxID=2291023 RepID=A0A3D8JZE7_9BURK|nr:hypothetical protein DWV00_12675 [Trinickia dinghuensis]